MKKSLALLTSLIVGASSVSMFSFKNNATIKQASAEGTFNYVDNELITVSIINGYHSGYKFLQFTLKDSDFNETPTVDYNLDLPSHIYNYRDVTTFGSETLIDGEKINSVGYDTYFRYYSYENTIGLRIPLETVNKIHDGSTIVVPAGTTFPSYKGMFVSGNNTLYRLKDEQTFTYSNGAFRMNVPVTKTESEVTAVDYLIGYNGHDTYLRYYIKGSDYEEIPDTEEFNKRNDFKLMGPPDKHVVNLLYNISNFGAAIIYREQQINFEGTEIFLNYKGGYGAIAIKFTDYIDLFKSYDTIVIPAGTTFPSFKCSIGQNDIVYETKTAKTFTYYLGEFHCCEDNATEGYDKNSSKHWKKCSVCSKHLSEAEHTIIFGDKPATCTEEGYRNSQYCSVCGYLQSSGTPIEPLGHDFSGEYQYNDTHHWKVCQREGCNFKDTLHGHTFNNDFSHCDQCDFSRNAIKVVVVNGYINGNNDGIALIGSTVVVIPNPPADGKVFEAWYEGNDKVSELSTYSFIADHSLVLEARYKNAPKQPDEGNSSKGCGGSIAATSIILSTLSISGVAILLSKKKED